jgi:hypothetical protein
MGSGNWFNPEDPSFIDMNKLTTLAQFSQPPTEGGLINTVIYARQKYGARPPDGYTPNISAVIDLLNSLESQSSDPQTKSSISGAIEYLTYLNGILSNELPQLVSKLISETINATLD